MTKTKHNLIPVKMGRKPHKLKNHQDQLLKTFFFSREFTPWQVSLYAGCGYEYALKKFREFRVNSEPKNTCPDF